MEQERKTWRRCSKSAHHLLIEGCIQGGANGMSASLFPGTPTSSKCVSFRPRETSRSWSTQTKPARRPQRMHCTTSRLMEKQR
jgi:hypothetical protein